MDQLEKEHEKKTKSQIDMEYAKEHLKRVPLNFVFAEYEQIAAAAAASNQKVGTYIKTAIAEKMERDGFHLVVDKRRKKDSI